MPKESQETRYQRVVERIEKVQNHLAAIPRGDRLRGKVCVLTGVGSAKGVGRATALAFAHQGPKHLYLFDIDGKHLPEAKESLESKYPDVKVTIIQGDAADEKTVIDLCQRVVDEEGRLDVFFANAATLGLVKNLRYITVDEWNRVMHINGLSVFLAVKYASAAMLKANKGAGGSIIFTASVAGIRANGGPVEYSASKAAVISMSQTSAFQLAGTNIRVNSVCPGLLDTDMSKEIFDRSKALKKPVRFGEFTALRRHGLPEEVAQVALFLASDESSFVNAQVIAVDGGFSASHPPTDTI